MVSRQPFPADPGIRAYVDVLVPRVFEPWGRLLLGELDVGPGDRVLDVASGTGVVARLASAAARAAGSVTACDLSSEMIAAAATVPAPVGGAPIEYLQCPADDLAVPDAGFDVATCQQGIQFFPDRPTAVGEMRRALRRGGRVGIAAWTEIEASPPFASLASAVDRVLGPAAAATYRGGPWGFSDPGRLGELLAAAGFANVRVERRTLPVQFEGGPEQVARTLQTGPVAGDVAALDAVRRSRLDVEIAAALAPLLRDGAVESELVANVAVGVA